MGQPDNASAEVVHVGAELDEAQSRQALAARILEELNKPTEKLDVIRRILELVKEHTGFDAVAIRLREGLDFPYFVTSGFPAEFVEAENYLCARDAEGELVRDSKGNPRLECMCGNILSGRTDPSLPFFTECGSFWTNSTSKLLSCTSEEERQGRTRDRCHGQGYESVALIPLRAEGEIVGLLQLNDSGTDRLSPGMVSFFERIGNSIGIAMSRRRAEERIRKSEERLRVIFESMPWCLLVMDARGRVQAVNKVLEQTFGVNSGEVINKPIGVALRCAHSLARAEECGSLDVCNRCEVRNAGSEALAGRPVHRRRARVELALDGKTQERVLLVSATPLDYEDKRSALLVLEDVTELNILRRRLKTEQSFAGIVGRDAKMLELFDTLRQVAEVKAPVLIQGESGTGKELVAAAIHNEGQRAKKLFVPVNCGALPEGLLESELFGHVRGAFTGAIRDKKGRFELADGGTIFLDEIGDIPPAMQVKLLRVLQEGNFERVGDTRTVHSDVRVISATNKDLKKEIADGRFREDLYYRLCVVPIELPPLRERCGDIPLLVDHIVKRIASESGRELSLSPAALDAVLSYEWPGNVRELQNALQFALVKCKSDVIGVNHLPPHIISSTTGPSRSGVTAQATPPASVVSTVRSGVRRRGKLTAGAVAEAMRRTGGNKAKAARLLGVGRATLYRFLKNSR